MNLTTILNDFHLWSNTTVAVISASCIGIIYALAWLWRAITEELDDAAKYREAVKNLELERNKR